MSEQLAYVTGVFTFTKRNKTHHFCGIKYFTGMFKNEIQMPNPNEEFKINDIVTITITKKERK